MLAAQGFMAGGAALLGLIANHGGSDLRWRWPAG